MSELPGRFGGGSEPITIPEVLETLSGGVMHDEHGLLPWGSNYAYLVTISDDDRTVLAVYKPQRGERPLWDFPDGTLCYREVAAFLTSEMLGWQLVPPTVLRGGVYGVGSVQFYIEHDPEMNYFTPFPPETIDQLQRVVAFDYVVNNADRKGGHCLLDEQGHLWGIDHGLTFNHIPKLRTVIWDYAGQPLPDAIVQDMQALCNTLRAERDEAVKTLRELLSEREIDALLKRIERLLDVRIFPKPGPGPNYPWPPV